MTNNQERRRFQRIEFDAPVTITQGEFSAQTDIIDISLRGLLANMVENSINAEQQCHLSIALSTDIVIELKGEPVYQTEHGLGFTITPDDLDSMVHLRRILELNAEDDSLLDRSFSNLSPD